MGITLFYPSMSYIPIIYVINGMQLYIMTVRIMWINTVKSMVLINRTFNDQNKTNVA